MFGKMVGNVRQGWAHLRRDDGALHRRSLADGALTSTHPRRRCVPRASLRPLPEPEGKELRYGTDQSSLWAVATTDASNGSVNSMHDSYKPDSMVAPMFNLGVGEVIWGGVGSGLYGMLFYVIIAVFIGGLMVGRTPRVPRQEDRRTLRSSSRRSRSWCHSSSCSRSPRWRWRRPPPGLDARLNAGPHQVSPRDRLRLPVHGQQQRFGVRRCSPRAGRSTPFGGGIDDARSFGSFPGCSRRSSLGGLPGEGRHRAGDGRDTADRQAAVQSDWAAASFVIIGALTFFPALALGGD